MVAVCLSYSNSGSDRGSVSVRVLRVVGSSNRAIGFGGLAFFVFRCSFSCAFLSFVVKNQNVSFFFYTLFLRKNLIFLDSCVIATVAGITHTIFNSIFCVRRITAKVQTPRY